MEDNLVPDLFNGGYSGVCWRVFGLEKGDQGQSLPPATAPDSLKELSTPAAALIGATILKFKLFDNLLGAVDAGGALRRPGKATTPKVEFDTKLGEVIMDIPEPATY